MRERFDRLGVTTPAGSESSSSRAEGAKEVRSEEDLRAFEDGRLSVVSAWLRVSARSLGGGVRARLKKHGQSDDLPELSSLLPSSSLSSEPTLRGTRRTVKDFFIVSQSCELRRQLLVFVRNQASDAFARLLSRKS